MSLKKLRKAWRDGSVVNNTDGSSRGPRFIFHQNAVSQASVTPVPEDLLASSGTGFLHGAQTYMQIKHSHT